jgi:hypothetical protein
MMSFMRGEESAAGKRSDVLRALIWPTGLLLTATVSSGIYRAPTWLPILLGVLTAGYVIMYGFGFLWCLLRNPDLLRSESYNAHKMAIEHGLLGDHTTGLQDVTPARPRLAAHDAPIADLSGGDGS